MFDALYPEAADQAIADRARAPVLTPDVPWFKDAWSAVGKALPRAGAEIGRAITSLQTPEAAAAISAPSMFGGPTITPTQAGAELRQQDAAIRDAIREMTPDANTTGAASMILHEVTRFVGKASAYGMLGGAPGAIGGMALDEGRNEFLRRTDEGIDPATAAKLGVVKGISSGVAVALPVAGKTIGQTVALAAAGGPGSFIAEQITAREILENADYLEEAAKIDPFDPLGLGVAFFGSLIFGAGAHGARRLRTPPPQEHVDAAHVAVLQAQREEKALSPAVEDMEAHSRALDDASAQIAAGERVSVDAPVDVARAREMLDGPLSGLREAIEPEPTAAWPDYQPAASIEARLAQIEAETPDLPVMMEGMDAPVPMRQLLADIKTQAELEAKDADLYRVAAECAISTRE